MNLFSVEQICPLNTGVSRALTSVDLEYNNIPDIGKQQLRDAVEGKNINLKLLSMEVEHRA